VRRQELLVLHDTLRYDEHGKLLGDTIVPQDELAWIEQGAITDRTTEHLASSDKGIVLYHKLLLENIDKVERGEEPMAVIRDLEVNEPFIPIARGSTYASFQRGIESENYGGVRRFPTEARA